jgi:hypothetical protein
MQKSSTGDVGSGSLAPIPLTRPASGRSAAPLIAAVKSASHKTFGLMTFSTMGEPSITLSIHRLRRHAVDRFTRDAGHVRRGDHIVEREQR